MTESRKMRSTVICLAWLAMLAVSQVQASDVFEQEIKNYHDEVMEELEHSHNLNAEHMQALLSEKKNVCTNGLDAEKLSYKDYLEEFAKGPCNPAIFIPGIAGSKLRAVIDCPVLRRSDPDLFEKCGWRSCDGKGAPKSEYGIWIPHPFSAMSITKPFKKSRDCFAGLISLDSTFDDKGKIVYKEKVGITVAPIGETRDTRFNSQCGFNAITFLVDFDIGIDLKVMGYFDNLRLAFKGAGYRVGLTMQALPYDWRKGYKDNNLDFKFERTVDLLHEITGKKVIIAAHSMGNFQTAHNLWKMPQSKRNEKIARYFAMAPPFLGAPEASLGPFGMDNSFAKRISHVDLGLTASMFKHSIAGFPSTYELQLHRFFRVHQDSEFMKIIMARVAKEKKNEHTSESNFFNDFFPDAKEVCSPGFKERDDDSCKTGIRETWEVGTLLGMPINPDTMAELYEVFSYNPKAHKMRQSAEDTRFDSMINLGVQTIILYSNHMSSKNYLTYNEDPRTRTTFEEFYVPKIDYTQGDATVVTTSAIMPGVKWAYEFSNKDKFPEAKPVALVEICGIKNQKSHVFDDAEKRKTTKNQYIGLKCNCRKEGKLTQGKACDHQGLPGDLGLVEFVLESSIDNVPGQVGERFKNMTENDLKLFAEDCKIFYPKKDGSDFQPKLRIIKIGVDKQFI